jgi:hypothetical protein
MNAYKKRAQDQRICGEARVDHKPQLIHVVFTPFDCAQLGRDCGSERKYN